MPLGYQRPSMPDKTILLDYTCHALIIIATCLLANAYAHASLGLAFFLPCLLNVIYVGEYLNNEQRPRYAAIVELSSQFFKAVMFPRFALLSAAITSYFSFTNLKMVILATVAGRFRQSLVEGLLHLTGSRKSFAVLSWVEPGPTAGSLQRVFAVVDMIMRLMIVFRQILSAIDARAREVDAHVQLRRELDGKRAELERSWQDLWEQFMHSVKLLEQEEPMFAHVAEQLSQTNPQSTPFASEWINIIRNTASAAQRIASAQPERVLRAEQLVKLSERCVLLASEWAAFVDREARLVDSTAVAR